MSVIFNHFLYSSIHLFRYSFTSSLPPILLTFILLIYQLTPVLFSSVIHSPYLLLSITQSSNFSFLSLILVFQSGQEHRVIFVIRHPVDRIISQLNYFLSAQPPSFFEFQNKLTHTHTQTKKKGNEKEKNGVEGFSYDDFLVNAIESKNGKFGILRELSKNSYYGEDVLSHYKDNFFTKMNRNKNNENDEISSQSDYDKLLQNYNNDMNFLLEDLFTKSIYFSEILKYVKHFGIQNVKIVNYEDLVNDNIDNENNENSSENENNNAINNENNNNDNDNKHDNKNENENENESVDTGIDSTHTKKRKYFFSSNKDENFVNENDKNIVSNDKNNEEINSHRKLINLRGKNIVNNEEEIDGKKFENGRDENQDNYVENCNIEKNSKNKNNVDSETKKLDNNNLEDFNKNTESPTKFEMEENKERTNVFDFDHEEKFVLSNSEKTKDVLAEIETFLNICPYNYFSIPKIANNHRKLFSRKDIPKKFDLYAKFSKNENSNLENNGNKNNEINFFDGYIMSREIYRRLCVFFTPFNNRLRELNYIQKRKLYKIPKKYSENDKKQEKEEIYQNRKKEIFHSKNLERKIDLDSFWTFHRDKSKNENKNESENGIENNLINVIDDTKKFLNIVDNKDYSNDNNNSNLFDNIIENDISDNNENNENDNTIVNNQDIQNTNISSSKNNIIYSTNLSNQYHHNNTTNDTYINSINNIINEISNQFTEIKDSNTKITKFNQNSTISENTENTEKNSVNENLALAPFLRFRDKTKNSTSMFNSLFPSSPPFISISTDAINSNNSLPLNISNQAERLNLVQNSEVKENSPKFEKSIPLNADLILLRKNKNRNKNRRMRRKLSQINDNNNDNDNDNNENKKNENNSDETSKFIEISVNIDSWNNKIAPVYLPLLKVGQKTRRPLFWFEIDDRAAHRNRFVSLLLPVRYGTQCMQCMKNIFFLNVDVDILDTV